MACSNICYGREIVAATMLRLPPTPSPLRYRSESSMQRRRSKPHTFEQNIAAEKAKLEAQLANLKPGPEIEAIRKKIRQLDSAAHIGDWLRPIA